MPENQEEHPKAKKNDREALSNHYELTFFVWGLTGHVIYS
jgi:choline-glycine betaine transporter